MTDMNGETGKYTWSHAQGFRTFLRQTTAKFKSLQWAKNPLRVTISIRIGEEKFVQNIPISLHTMYHTCPAKIFLHRKVAQDFPFFFFFWRKANAEQTSTAILT